ncbi:MAG: hypothetical protein ACREP4_15495 [Stenotrophomonas sp.]|uniref:hypothetical protein n=1 Tax=Stenotrophomonas sp. TaxID=69392 RepID=UPI003D6D1BDC
MDKVLIKQLLFHGSWRVFPAIAGLLWRWRGIGEIGLPLRPVNPPTINVLQLQP